MRAMFCVALLLAPFVAAADDRPERSVKDRKLQKRIDDAIARGAQYLKSTQTEDGSWPVNHADHAGGVTALALYALAASKVPVTDAAIQKGLWWVTTHRAPYSPGGRYGTYSASLLVMALTRIDANKHRDRIHELAQLLVQSQFKSGMWGYPLLGEMSNRGMRMGGGDNSNAQFAIVALWAAERLAGFHVPREMWERIRRLYEKTQVGGGWGYRRGANRTASMTAAGLCAYVYAATALTGDADTARRSRTAKTGLQAMRKLRFHFGNYYYVYALERAGNVMDLPLKDWYVGGAKALVRAQGSSGRWDGRYVNNVGTFETSMALLFLTRATPAPERRPAAVTRSETFPDMAEPRGLERAFGFYVEYNAQDRARVLHRFGAAGPQAVGLFVLKLRDKNERTRAAAYELLTKLVDARFFYEPKWTLETRQAMLVPIDLWWKQNAHRLRFDGKRFTRATSPPR